MDRAKVRPSWVEVQAKAAGETLFVWAASERRIFASSAGAACAEASSKTISSYPSFAWKWN